MWRRGAGAAAAAVAVAAVAVGAGWQVPGVPVSGVLRERAAALDPTRWIARWQTVVDAQAAAPATPCPACPPCPTVSPTGAVWDPNWDYRARVVGASAAATVAAGAGDGGDPASAAVTGGGKEAADASAKGTATRYILLIRHGEYYDREDQPQKRVLTPLGREQSALSGQRLATMLHLPRLHNLVCSTMPRANETARIIVNELANAGWPVAASADDDVKSAKAIILKSDELLEEGNPIPPSPPLAHVRADHHYWRDGPRIEAAFRKYFHRASASQTEDSLDVLVCHANVIRYFVVRALQMPPEAWLRISLPHASMTLVVIRPSGNVSLRFLGDAGFIPVALTTA